MKENVFTQQSNKFVVPLILVGTGLFLGAATQQINLEAISSPLLTLGAALRALGASSWWGNVLLWLLVFAVSFAPIFYAIFRQYNASRLNNQTGIAFQQRKTAPDATALDATTPQAPPATDTITVAADCLLVLLCVQLFAICFFLVNPSYIPQSQGIVVQGVYISVSVWAMVATFGSYLLLRVAAFMQRLPTARAANLLPRLLYASASFILFISAAEASQSFFETFGGVSALNSIGGAMAGAFSQGDVAYLSFVLSLLQVGFALLCGMLLYWCGGVAAALLQAPYASETIALCQQRAKDCITVFLTVLLVGVAENLMQLLFFASLQDVSIAWSIPLLPLLLAGALFLLCHYVGGARALSEDNNSII